MRSASYWINVVKQSKAACHHMARIGRGKRESERTAADEKGKKVYLHIEMVDCAASQNMMLLAVLIFY
ncbi:hypothetical protein C3Z09_02100 [Lelliottia aquatilis]|nr:hypothetical protein C3Z09_02100 [Lelliottia aquatilis]